MQQDERVSVKEAARAAVAAERDRVVEEVKGSTEGPALMAMVEKVVNKAWMVVVPKREVVDSAAPV